MGKKRKRIVIDEAEIPMSAMIDVVFLLLIYFIVTQKPIIEETLLSCDLPAPGGAPPDKPPTMLTIGVMRMIPNPNHSQDIVNKDMNLYYLNNQAWKFNNPSASDDLKRRLIIMGKDDPKQTIIINCGPNAPHQKLVQLLDACANAGLKTLNIVNDESIRFLGDKKK